MATHDELENTSSVISFRPPVYVQRYEVVLELSRKLQPKKVIDMGCAECKLLKSLKFHKHIQSLIGVDIDPTLLRSHQHLVQPLISDYLIRRNNPLTVQLFKGSIDEVDSRLLSCDLFSCIEVIEHLHPPVLEQVPAVIFQKLRPSVVVISTPNADFNVLFPELVGFRHYDHKFEWTRKEFQAWCFRICSLYGNYQVEFDGVGRPPPGMDRYGYCSQIAIFTRCLSQKEDDESREELEEQTDTTPYELIHQCDYPYNPNPLTPQQQLSREAQYYLRMLSQRNSINNYNTTSSELSLDNGYHGNGSELTDTPRRRNYTRVDLFELLSFPRIQELASSSEQISDALEAWSSLELSDDRTSVLFYEESSSDEEEIEPEIEPEVGQEVEGRDENFTYELNSTEEFWD